LRFILLMPLSILSKKGFIDSMCGRTRKPSFLSLRENWKRQESEVPLKWRVKKSSWLPTDLFFQNPCFFMEALMIASLNGTAPEIHSINDLSPEDTFPLSSKIMKLS